MVNVSGRLLVGWVPAPMQISAFDRHESDAAAADLDMDEDAHTESMTDEEMA